MKKFIKSEISLWKDVRESLRHGVGKSSDILIVPYHKILTARDRVNAVTWPRIRLALERLMIG